MFSNSLYTLAVSHATLHLHIQQPIHKWANLWAANEHTKIAFLQDVRRQRSFMKFIEANVNCESIDWEQWKCIHCYFAILSLLAAMPGVCYVSHDKYPTQSPFWSNERHKSSLNSIHSSTVTVSNFNSVWLIRNICLLNWRMKSFCLHFRTICALFFIVHSICSTSFEVFTENTRSSLSSQRQRLWYLRALRSHGDAHNYTGNRWASILSRTCRKCSAFVVRWLTSRELTALFIFHVKTNFEKWEKKTLTKLEIW